MLRLVAFLAHFPVKVSTINAFSRKEKEQKDGKSCESPDAGRK